MVTGATLPIGDSVFLVIAAAAAAAAIVFVVVVIITIDIHSIGGTADYDDFLFRFQYTSIFYNCPLKDDLI